MAKFTLNNVLLSMIIFDLIFAFLMSSFDASIIAIPTLTLPSSVNLTAGADALLASWGVWKIDILGYIINFLPVEDFIVYMISTLVALSNLVVSILGFIPFVINIITLPSKIMPYPLSFIIESIFALTLVIMLITGVEIFSTRIHGD